jgi:hypothetical protein
VQYVSEFQREWHNYYKVPGVVIPNVMSPIEKKEKTLNFKKVGGVIGSVTPTKKTHISIQAALDDGCDKVLVFGGKDSLGLDYWKEKVFPFLEDERVLYLGICDDKSLMYSDLDVVYHSSERETFNYVEKECAMLGIPYIHTTEGNEGSGAVLASDDEIMGMWEEVFN